MSGFGKATLFVLYNLCIFVAHKNTPNIQPQNFINYEKGSLCFTNSDFFFV